MPQQSASCDHAQHIVNWRERFKQQLLDACNRATPYAAAGTRQRDAVVHPPNHASTKRELGKLVDLGLHGNYAITPKVVRTPTPDASCCLPPHERGHGQWLLPILPASVDVSAGTLSLIRGGRIASETMLGPHKRSRPWSAWSSQRRKTPAYTNVAEDVSIFSYQTMNRTCTCSGQSIWLYLVGPFCKLNPCISGITDMLRRRTCGRQLGKGAKRQRSTAAITSCEALHSCQCQGR